MLRQLTFSNEHILAVLIEGDEEYEIFDKTIVVNLGTKPIIIPDAPDQALPPFHSSIFRNVELHGVECAAAIRVEDGLKHAELPGDLQWDRFSSLLEMPAPEIMNLNLFRSKQEFIGQTILEGHILGVEDGDAHAVPYDVGLNLWYAPAGTDCLIHRVHPFLETHVQIFGQGRMQKFRQESPSTLYQDIAILPGAAHPFFQCRKRDDGSFVYPWHQYRADTDCVWMAIECHPSGPTA